MVITCKIGRIVFNEGTVLSQAKIVRDNLLGRLLWPKPDEKRLRSEQECYDFVRNDCGNVLENVRFKLSLADGVI